MVPQAPTQTPPQGPPPTPAQRQPTLEEYAAGVNQTNTDLQRQSAAYGHYREVLAQIDAIAGDPANSDRINLPFVIVRFPQQGPTPGETKIDMNAVPVEQLPTFRPLFECLTTQAGEALVAAWTNMHNLADATKAIIAAAQRTGG